MKKYIYAFSLLILTSACLRVEELEQNTSNKDAVRMQLAASIEVKETETKTFLDGEPAASVRNTYWLPDDEIAVVWNNEVSLFQNVKQEMDKVALFEGDVIPSDEYYALYPYSAYFDLENGSHSFDDGTMDINIPTQQPYSPDTFATDVVPMVVKFKPGNTLNFKNVCGGFVLKLTGEETIVSTSLVLYDSKGDEANISGHFRVYMDTESYEMKSVNDAEMYVSIDCGDGVKLSPDSPTSFHFVLPPAIYNGFKANFISSDGKTMVIKSDKELNIRRSNITYAPSLAFEDNVDSSDLSGFGTSNSYIITEPGTYSFAANVIGNGLFGLVDGANFHTDTPFIHPESAEILWQDREGVITDLQLSGERIRFNASGKKGNALVAVKDASGIILWSWHIWATDRPKEITYETEAASYKILDRNIGSVRAEDSSEIDNILYFQWGRKDPLPLKTEYWTEESVTFTLPDAIQNPTVMSTNYYVDHQCSTREWMEPTNNNLWKKGKKTIYDPCPPGYKVVDPEVFASIDNSPSEGENGYELRIAGDDVGYFPITGHYDGNGDYREDYMSHILTSENGKSLSVGVGVVGITNNFRSAAGVPVRCMKDESINVIFNDIHFNDVTSSSVTVLASVDEAGEVLERGFVYGTSPDVDLETGIRIVCEKNNMSSTVTGLKESTRYYFKIYIVFPDKTIYSSAASLFTPSHDGVYNLSSAGTSNSYIVSMPGTYKFNATVKGNGKESVGIPETVSVLWETLNTDNMIEVGDVITDVTFDGTYVMFKTPDELRPGNALVAVRDDDERVLWSWHIWVTEVNPEGLAVKYQDGSFVMDRNLGALTNDISDVRSFGLFYQWGRKDPFVGCGNFYSYAPAVTAPEQAKKYVKNGSDTDLMSYAISRPSYVIQESKWNDDNTLWRSVKTIYDPCPVGWRVADHSTLEGRNGATYPFAGYTDGNDGLNAVGSEYYVWTVSQANGVYQVGSCVGFDGWNDRQGCTDVYKEHNVRCMKDADFALVNTEILDLTPYSIVISADVTVSDATVIKRKGFVISDDDDRLSLDEGTIVVESGDGMGEFSAEIKDLLPNKRYYIRAFAMGGYNTKYGDCVLFMTDKAGNGEDFKDGGDYEWD